MAPPTPPADPRVVPRDPTRIVVEGVRPQVDAGRFAAKAVVGEPIHVEADVFAEGHDLVAAALWVRGPGDTSTTEIPMAPLGNDRFRATLVPDRLGRWAYTVVGWVDRFETWRDGTIRKVDADQDVRVDMRIGAQVVADAATHAKGTDADLLSDTAADFERGSVDLLDDPTVSIAMRRWSPRDPVVRHVRTLELQVESVRAGHGAWYEFFPRSSSGDAHRHGTLRDAADRLEYVAGMGFDVVYLPPVHPIGTSFRKGRNNTVDAEADDTGSPWGIGSAEGGHTAIHPELGDLDDFAHFVATAGSLGLEVALDLAFQCSPDHPWVTEHPEWFKHRPDGTIQYAENPPKKYQDIYPIDFETESWEALWDALADVVRCWIDRGVRIFRVDNPHTKPFRFWEWLIGTIHAEHPDVVFLSEAFTRPKVMYQLAKLGFSQSYTYFTWRQSAWELREYFTELTTPPVVDFFRPNAWPNTPDILTEQLQQGGRPVFIQRLVLAATLSANYGIYGPAFELVEHRAVREGSEEYLDSEKYQLRQWDLDAPHSLRDLIALVNRVRRTHQALHHDRTLHFHQTDNDHLLCYSKTTLDGADPVLVVVNTDPHQRQGGWVTLDLDALGLAHDEPFTVHDLLASGTYTWQGASNFVELDPQVLPAHVFSVAPTMSGTPTS
jgi:starch synthase (maltosyl-transferring)